MKKTYGTLLALCLVASALGGCASLLFGGTSAYIADSVVEDQRGGDGLF